MRSEKMADQSETAATASAGQGSQCFDTGALNEHLICTVCHDIFKCPKILCCGHSFCYQCLEKWFSEDASSDDEIKCPQCNHITSLNACGVAGLSTNFQLDAILDALSGEVTKKSPSPPHGSDDDLKVCDLCSMNSKEHSTHVPNATSHCATCDVNLCVKCIAKHAAHPALSDHQVTIIEESEAEKIEEVFCEVHKQVTMKYSCEECARLLCTFCIIEHDPEHKTSKFDLSAVGKIENDLKDQCEELRKKLRDVNNELSLFQVTCRQNQGSAVQGTREAIKDAANKVVILVRDQEKILLEELDTRVKDAEAEGKKDAMVFKAKVVNMVLEIENLLQGSTQERFFRSQVMLERASSLEPMPKVSPPIPEFFSCLNHFFPSEGIDVGELINGTAKLRHTFNNVSSWEKNFIYYSQSQIAYNFKWKLSAKRKLYKDEERFGCFLRCESLVGLKKWSVKTRFQIKLLAAKADKEPNIYVYFVTGLNMTVEQDDTATFTEDGIGHGQRWSCKHVLNSDSGFIKDDCLTVEVLICAQTPQTQE